MRHAAAGLLGEGAGAGVYFFLIGVGVSSANSAPMRWPFRQALVSLRYISQAPWTRLLRRMFLCRPYGYIRRSPRISFAPPSASLFIALHRSTGFGITKKAHARSNE